MLTSPKAAGLAAIAVPRPKMSKIDTPVSPASAVARAKFICVASEVPKNDATGPLAVIAGERPILGVSQTTICAAPPALSSLTMVTMLLANEAAVAAIIV